MKEIWKNIKNYEELNALVNACCRGKIKKTYGYRWEYADKV